MRGSPVGRMGWTGIVDSQRMGRRGVETQSYVNDISRLVWWHLRGFRSRVDARVRDARWRREGLGAEVWGRGVIIINFVGLECTRRERAWDCAWGKGKGQGTGLMLHAL